MDRSRGGLEVLDPEFEIVFGSRCEYEVTSVPLCCFFKFTKLALEERSSVRQV